MANQDDSKQPQGRKYDQATKGGSGSAASMGAGGTGDVGNKSGVANAGNAQSETRTDDWLSRGTEQEREQGFRPKDPGAIKTGMEGIAGKKP
ncbi:MAG: hypothetical protein WCC39_19845 [Telluria sp.]